MSLQQLLAHGWLVLLLVVWTALCIGSFLNVVVHRLPRILQREWREQAQEVLEQTPSEQAEPPGERFNLLVPRSRCPHCAAPVRAWQNIPVVSWLLLRGRCRACGAPISLRYPAVELLTLLLSVAVLAQFGYSGTALAALVFTWSLIALTFIDYDTQLLPDNITLPLLWLGLLVNTAGLVTDLSSAVIGAAAGYLLLWSLYWAFKLATGKEGMGYGDFKLLGALGAWLGWQALPGLILIAALAGLLVGGGVQLARRSRGPIPFGPFLALAGWIALVWHDRIVGVALGTL
jgi:leader peptidase (prepilin peptidase) / N-methyltransferase